MEQQLKSYRQMHVSGLNQKDLIVLLYSGALKFIDEGKHWIDKKDVPRTHEKLNRARDIFLHLLATLNMDEGGEIADKLSSLYAYFVEKITTANVANSKADLDEIIPLIVDIKDSWEKIEYQDEQVETPGQSRFDQTPVFSTKV